VYSTLEWTLSEDGKTYHPYCFHQKAFTPDECQHIIRSFAANLKKAEVGATGGQKVVPEIRRSEVSWIEYSSFSDWVFARLKAVADAAVRDYFPTLDLRGYTEPLQLTKYVAQEKGHYDWHKDFGGGEMVRRKLSQVVLLSDPKDFEGGQLEMSSLGLVTELQQGTVISFPSYEEHRVLPVTKGERWSLVAWISGPRFR
jgi:PKHD-type hydroxylase